MASREYEKLKEAIYTIREFWVEPNFPSGTFNYEVEVERLMKEFGRVLPKNLITYLAIGAPREDFYFTTVGNPMRLYGYSNMKLLQNGYNYNPVSDAPIEGNWEDNWFMIGDQGADPVIIDLDAPERIKKLWHGSGSWQSGEYIADSIGQFLLCSAALHFALHNFEDFSEDGEVIMDDENGFCLIPEAANWFFPKLKNWAGKYYDAWTEDFDNA